MSLANIPYRTMYTLEELIERYKEMRGDSEEFSKALAEWLRPYGRVLLLLFLPNPIPKVETTFSSGIALVDGVRRIAENTEKIASALNAIAGMAPLLTPPIGVEKVAELAGVAVKTVYRWKRQGLLKPLAENKPLLFDQHEVHDFLRQRRRGSV